MLHVTKDNNKKDYYTYEVVKAKFFINTSYPGGEIENDETIEVEMKTCKKCLSRFISAQDHPISDCEIYVIESMMKL